MKKALKIIGLCCIVGIIVVGVYINTPSKTLDFSGTVTAIEHSANEVTFYISTPSIRSSYMVVADNKTKIKPCHKDDHDIELSDIKVGDTIDGNYRWLTKNNTTKFITVECHN